MIWLAVPAAWLLVSAIVLYGLGRATEAADTRLADVGPEPGFYEQVVLDAQARRKAASAFERHVAQALTQANPALDVSLLPEEERDDVLAWEREYANRRRS